MRRILAVMFVICLLVGGRSVSAKDASLSDLKAWVGKYPADIIDGQTLWDNEALKAEASKFIGPKTQNYIFNDLGRQVAIPIQMKDDVLYVSVCKAHACPDVAAQLFVDMKKKKLSICWRYTTEKEDLWLTAGAEPRRIGESGCDEPEPYDLFNKYGKD